MVVAPTRLDKKLAEWFCEGQLTIEDALQELDQEEDK